jgi:hypothetical protein
LYIYHRFSNAAKRRCRRVFTGGVRFLGHNSLVEIAFKIAAQSFDH